MYSLFPFSQYITLVTLFLTSKQKETILFVLHPTPSTL